MPRRRGRAPDPRAGKHAARRTSRRRPTRAVVYGIGNRDCPGRQPRRPACASPVVFAGALAASSWLPVAGRVPSDCGMLGGLHRWGGDRPLRWEQHSMLDNV